MAGFEATFDTKAVNDLLKQITTNLTKIEKKNREVAGIMSAIVFKDVMKHFEEQKGSSGRWQSWSKSYATFMSRVGKGGNKILQDSGRLRNSFTIKNYRVVGSGIEWFNPGKTSKGFPYAFAHDEGGPVLPQRRFMWLSDGSISDMETQMLKFLEG